MLDPERLDFIRRHSRVHLDREGGWTFDGRRVEHPRVAALFHQGTRPGEEPGEFILQVGEQWCYIEQIEDTAFFVSKLRLDEAGKLVGELLGGEHVSLPPAGMTRRGDTQVYVDLADGRRARLLRDAVASMASIMQEQAGVLGVVVQDVFYRIPSE